MDHRIDKVSIGKRISRLQTTEDFALLYLDTLSFID